MKILLLFCIFVFSNILTETRGFSGEQLNHAQSIGSIRILRKSKSLGGLSEQGESVSKNQSEQLPRRVLVNVILSEEVSEATKFFTENYFAKCRHENKCSKEIVLDFGDISYIFPEVILHYMDDKQTKGLAWLPPVDFLLNLKYGNYILQEEKLLKQADKNIHKIGYLVKDREQIIETHGGDFNIKHDKYRDVPVCKRANMSSEHQVEEEIIEILSNILEFVNDKGPEEFDPRKAIEGIGVVEYQFTKRPVHVHQENQKPFSVKSYFEANIFLNSKERSCEPPHCFNFTQVIKNTLEDGFESREQAEKVYRARLNINNKISAFLPSLGLGDVMALAQKNFSSVIPSLLGFAFPSNWFAFKESNKLLDAELASYRTLLANQVTTVGSLYIMIHNQLTNRDILIYYHQLIQRAIDYISKQEKLLARKIDSEDIGYLKNLLARVEKQLLDVQSLIDDLRPELASLFNFQGDWQKFTIEVLDLTVAREIISTDLDRHLNLVYEKSSELATLVSLRKAANISRKSKYFDFLDPEGEGLGFNFATKVKIAKSEQDEVGIRIEKMQTRLKLALNIALNAYNTAVDTYKNSEQQIESLKSSASALSTHLLSFEDLDLESIDRYFENAILADIQKNTSMHMFKQSLESLDRLKWKGDMYEDIEKLRLVGNQPVW